MERAWDQTGDDDGHSRRGERYGQRNDEDGDYVADNSPRDRPGVVQDVANDGGDPNRQVIFTVACSDIRDEVTSD
jgi:hypothetical protein